jgi:hypothetical protein
MLPGYGSLLVSLFSSTPCWLCMRIDVVLANGASVLVSRIDCCGLTDFVNLKVASDPASQAQVF